MSTRYQKTDKGLAEIGTRAHRLPPRLRQALIMVDGRKTSDDLRNLLGPATDEILQALAAQGFIEAAAAGMPAYPARQSSPAPVPASIVDLGPIQRGSIRMLTDLIGPVAEGLALKIERARTAAELRVLLELGRQSIRNTRGAAAAAEFGARFIDVL